MEKDCKKNFWKLASVLISVISVAILAVVVMDPFYQYHSPWLGIPVILDNAVYQTPGAARNLEYTDVIVGTSMTENFHTSWFDEGLGWNTLKLSYSGARSDDLNAIFAQVFTRKEPVNHVLMNINDYQLTVPSWTAYVERPGYLYSTSVWDDYAYLLNHDVLAVGWKRVLDGLCGVGDNRDVAYTWEDPGLFGAAYALDDARGRREQLMKAGNEIPDAGGELQEMLLVCRESLDNILPFMEEHPKTEFIVFFPPYSMLYWEQKVLEQKLANYMQVYKYAIECFLEYDNVSVFYFHDAEEIITNLDNYRDTTHHRPEYNRYIFECIKNGDCQITKDNLERRIQDMYEFARDYDYEGYWKG